MLDSFLTFINQHTPQLKKQPTLLAVSGGIDSAVMAHLFHTMGFKAGIAHCNFGLRGEESEGDEAFVKDLADRYGFPFFSTHPDTHKIAASRKVSTQMAARDLRYEWFENVRQEFDYQWIATAHHANDSLETLLLNLVRGTGLPGLHGIMPVSRKLIRPLILASRAEVEEYAAENQLQWREDRSNSTDKYARNKIRHHVIPVLQQLNPSLEATFLQTSERLRAANLLLEEYLGKWKSDVADDQGGVMRIPIRSLREETEPAYRLLGILQPYGYSYPQAKDIIKALTGIPGKKFHSPSHVLLVDREDLILKQRVEELAQGEILVDVGQETFEWGRFKFIMREKAEEAMRDGDRIELDADQLMFPLKIRKWRQGDVFCPFGMHGKRKKVSDLLVEKKINLFEKEGVCVLVNGNEEIVWVVGFRADERFRTRETSKNILVISMHKHL
nr:tRNA lysidine(34) synthetase TilS [uncultured Dyadobacter sp.]